MIIRPEQASDVARIHQLTRSAFKGLAHSAETEHLIVDQLRQSGALSLSLVAEMADFDGVVGHVALSPVSIADGSSNSAEGFNNSAEGSNNSAEGSNNSAEGSSNSAEGSSNWFGLGPISVWPDKQRLGIGSALMRAALAHLKQSGAAGCVLLGDPNYYQRFGFEQAHPLTYSGAPSEYFQSISFGAPPTHGEVYYHAAFSLQA